MAKFDIWVNIMANVDEALKQISTFKGKALNAFARLDQSLVKMGKNNKVVDLNFQKLGMTLALVGKLSAKAFSKMIAASPSLQIALFMINVEMENMWRSIGEELGPVIEEYLLPIFNKFSEFIQGLSPEVRLFIGVTIGLTVAMMALVGVVTVLMAVSWPLIALIVGIAAGVALIIVLYTRWDEIMSKLSEQTLGFKIVLGIFLLTVGLAFLPIIFIIALIKNWGTLMSWAGDIGTKLGEIFGKIGNIFSDLGDNMGDTGDTMGASIISMIDYLDIFADIWDNFVVYISDKWTTAFEFIGNAWKNFMTLFSTAGSFFDTVITNITIGITTIVKEFINTLLDAIITPLNAYFDLMRTVFASLGISDTIIAKIPTINTPSYHEGGTYTGNEGYIRVKGGERIRTSTQERALQSQLSNNNGGGNTINISIQIDNLNNRDDVDYLLERLKEELTKEQYKSGVF